MSETTTSSPSARPAWVDAGIVGTVFAVVIMPASPNVGLGMFVVNLAALACFVAPVVAWARQD